MSQPKKANFAAIRNAFHIKRYHSVGFVAQPETVGHHTAQVIAILFYLYDDNPPIHVIRYALHHDVAELSTGDVPATAKWHWKKLKEALDQAEAEVGEEYGLQGFSTLTPAEQALVKFADMFDLCMKGVEELSVGNAPFSAVLGRGMDYCKTLLKTELKNCKPAIELFAFLHANNFVTIVEDSASPDPERMH